MNCITHDRTCAYHACMSDDCQRAVVLEQGVTHLGPGKCRKPHIYTPDQPLRALSWKEPFASLMLHGKIETRTWKTNYRGWVLICASKVSYDTDQVMRISGLNQTNRIIEVIEYNSLLTSPGNAIAIGRLVLCRKMTPDDEDRCFVEYQPGLLCHIYEHVQPIEMFPWKGSQGWGVVPEGIRKSIRIIK